MNQMAIGNGKEWQNVPKLSLFGMLILSTFSISSPYFQNGQSGSGKKWQKGTLIFKNGQSGIGKEYQHSPFLGHATFCHFLYFNPWFSKMDKVAVAKSGQEYQNLLFLGHVTLSISTPFNLWKMDKEESGKRWATTSTNYSVFNFNI